MIAARVKSLGGRSHHWANLAALGGLAWGLLWFLLWFRSGVATFPGGDVIDIYGQAGAAFRAGEPVYGARDLGHSFYYAPPWAVAFGLLTVLPAPLLQVLITTTEILALRYMAGSWVGSAMALWFPFVPLELASGNINLIVAAGIVAAVKGDSRLAVPGILAKISPLLAFDRRAVRCAWPAMAFAVAITVPWAPLWIEWARQLIAAAGQPGIGPQIAIGFVPRVLLAIPLLLHRRQWSRALAAAIAVPAYYWISTTLLLAPVFVALRNPESTSEPRSAQRLGPGGRS